MDVPDLTDLTALVVRAKRRTYAGSGRPEALSSRPGSVDLRYDEGPWVYVDSYVGGSDFLGQELVALDGRPVWAMNYYGYLLEPELMDAAAAGSVIKAALTSLYAQGRFLGGYRWVDGDDVYVDTSVGDVARFRGEERIERRGRRVYELTYHGGLVVP